MKETESSETTQKSSPLKLYSVESRHVRGGPRGVGDPDDKTLRNAELHNIIPKMARDKAKQECQTEGRLFGECASRTGPFVVTRCRREAEDLRVCVLSYLDDPVFIQGIKDLYIEQRTYYRTNGVPRPDATKRR